MGHAKGWYPFCLHFCHLQINRFAKNKFQCIGRWSAVRRFAGTICESDFQRRMSRQKWGVCWWQPFVYFEPKKTRNVWRKLSIWSVHEGHGIKVDLILGWFWWATCWYKEKWTSWLDQLVSSMWTRCTRRICEDITSLWVDYGKNQVAVIKQCRPTFSNYRDCISMEEKHRAFYVFKLNWNKMKYIQFEQEYFYLFNYGPNFSKNWHNF